MNRGQRRRNARRIAEFKRYAEQQGARWGVTGLRDACPDCSARGDITVEPDGRAVADIWHQPSCPWMNGQTRNQPTRGHTE